MSKEVFLQQFFDLPIRFPRVLCLNEKLAGKTFVGNDVTSIDPSIIEQLYMNTAAPITVTNHLKSEKFDIARAETVSYLDAIRILPKRDERYMYEAGIYRPEVLLPMQLRGFLLTSIGEL